MPGGAWLGIASFEGFPEFTRFSIRIPAEGPKDLGLRSTTELPRPAYILSWNHGARNVCLVERSVLYSNMPICKLCRKKYEDYQGKMRARCGACNTKIRRYRAKAAAIKLLGGKCADCGWRGNQAALQFHHRAPEHKDFTLGNVANKSWDFIRTELKKCILLCANCHATRHSSKEERRFLLEASRYRGRKLLF